MAHSRPARVADRLGQLDYDAKIEKSDYDSNWACCKQQAGARGARPEIQDRSLVLVFEGRDAAGKGGAIRRVTHALDARQFDITPVAAPNSEALARPYLWRFWRQVPRHGRIAIFDRSWYGRVLVERVEKLAAPATWRRAYAEINDFEEQLVASGAMVLKFWLAVTPDVQLERFKEREKSPFRTSRSPRRTGATATSGKTTRPPPTKCWPGPTSPTRPGIWYLPTTKRYARVQVLRHIVEAMENQH